ncbi:MAG: hypothetical protein ACXW0J_02790 [Nitrososphaeraceae archaeon]
MSRQNKQARKKQLAKQFTALHKAGQKGPAKTKKLSTKVKTWRSLKRAGKPIPKPRQEDEAVEV